MFFKKQQVELETESNKPVYNPFPTIVEHLEDMVGKRIRFYDEGKRENNSGNVVDVYQYTDQHDKVHTFLTVQAVGRLNPVMVYETDFQGFTSYQVRIEKQS